MEMGVTRPAGMEVGVKRPAPTALESVTKKVQLRSRGRVIGVVRESYLRSGTCICTAPAPHLHLHLHILPRTDIACRSALCFEGCTHLEEKGGKLATLPADVTHYLIPFTDVASKFMEVIEVEELSGVIFAQTVVNELQQSSLKLYRRVCQYIRHQPNRSVFFPNEFSKATYLAREEGETVREWQARMVYQVGLWYYDHLGGQKPVVLVSEDPRVVEAFATRRVEVFVLSLATYLATFWPGHTRALELYRSIQAAATSPEARVQEGFADYYRPEVLEAGLRSGKFVSGRLAVNKHLAATEAFVSRVSKDSDKVAGGDVLVAGQEARNRAVDGDTVVLELLPKSEWAAKATHLALTEQEKDEGRAWGRGADVMASGRVVGVLARGWRDYIATLPRVEEDSMDKAAGKRILVYPYDRRIPKIRILTSQYRALQGCRVVVRIDAWPTSSLYPQGHFVKLLGKAGDLETEIDTILAENSISPLAFSRGLLAEHMTVEAATAWRPSAEEVAGRRDLRSTLVMSIDPRGCEDVDDALSVRRLGDGALEVGVHIADVTHFLRQGGLTDLEAARRATTVYLADRRYDMLPPVLSAQLCSLLGGVERLAVSTVWTLHPTTYRVKEVWYGRTVIKSSYKLCYEHAQDIIDGKPAEEMQEVVAELAGLRGEKLGDRFAELREALVLLSTVARKWQGTRQKEGALNLESTEVLYIYLLHLHLHIHLRCNSSLTRGGWRRSGRSATWRSTRRWRSA